MNIADALKYGRDGLAAMESPEIDSQVLLCHVLNRTTAYLLTWQDKGLTLEQKNEFVSLIERRQQGYPVAHLTGKRGFWSLDLTVTNDTLIPRPDTELLVSLALAKITDDMCIADLGTGSGAIALSLAIEKPNNTFIAMDYSFPALLVAKVNAVNNNVNKVFFWQGSWLEAIAEKSVDMIVSNPPYIEQDDPHLLEGDVRFEPMTALASGTDGLDDIRKIIAQAKYCLRPLGWLMIEHGYHQAQQVIQLFEQASFVAVKSEQDFGGNDRVVIGKISA
jgi:release factor glutamine methyltransferase